MFQALESHTALSKFDSLWLQQRFFETGTESSSCRRHLPSGLTSSCVLLLLPLILFFVLTFTLGKFSSTCCRLPDFLAEEIPHRASCGVWRRILGFDTVLVQAQLL